MDPEVPEDIDIPIFTTEGYLLSEKENKIQVSPFSKGTSKDNKYISSVFRGSPDLNLRVSPLIELKLSYITDKNDTTYFSLEKFKMEKGIPTSVEKVTFSSFDLAKLGVLLEFIQKLDLPGLTRGKIQLSDNLVEISAEDEKKLFTLLSSAEGFSTIKELLSSTVTSTDLVNIGFRKGQLEIFGKLLKSAEFRADYRLKEDIKKPGDEAIWQYFFEKNTWIFGYGLNYVWCSKIDTEEKLEQIIEGHAFNQGGKIADGLMKTIAYINQFILIEIKTPGADLVEAKKYRTECWVPGEDLRGGISQLQKSAYLFKKKIADKHQIKDSDGNPKNEEIFNYSPKSYLLIGKLDQFSTPEGLVNEEKYSSFELYRRDMKQIEVITYDELYERARFIIEYAEKNS